MERIRERFTVDAFARRTNVLVLDPFGVQSIAAFLDNDTLYVLSCAITLNTKITLSSFDISLLRSYFVDEKFIAIYNHGFFNNYRPFEPLRTFNIRDMMVQNSTIIRDEESGLSLTATNIIATCYNNGILYFQAMRDVITEIDEFSNTVYKVGEVYLNMTDSEFHAGLGGIFKAEDFRFSKTESVIYFAISTPPSIIEINIANNNPRQRKIYTLPTALRAHFIGQNKVAANEQFVVMLAFNTQEWRHNLCIFLRKEAITKVWHTSISLREPAQLTSLHFL